jgi:hypothetical protein
MGSSHRHAATRKRLAVLVGAVALVAAPARAGDRPDLRLPLVTTIALVTAASHAAAPTQVAVVGPGGRPVLSLLPHQLLVEDGYEYDPEDYLPRRLSATVYDSDRIVGYELFRRPRRGWMASVSYDEVSRGPLTGRSDVLSLTFEYRF